MRSQRIVLQASSQSWLGGRDLCMKELNGRPVVYWTAKRLLDRLPGAHLVVAAPAFDRGGDLEFLTDSFPAGKVALFYGDDESPLDRLVNTCADLADEDYILRVDGLHFCVDVDAGLRLLDMARADRLDCVKLPDDFPAQFTSDAYRIGALRAARCKLRTEPPQVQATFKIHPKFYMFMRRDEFRCAYLQDVPSYTDQHLLDCRELANSIFNEDRLEINERRIWSADQLSFHYELALDHVQPGMRVLDVACGNGFGCRMLAKKDAEVHGADIDAEVIAEARRLTHAANVVYHVEDVTQMDFPSGEFDVVTSMETIEHIDDRACLREIHRVLKRGGVLVLSTPQNRMGRIPVIAAHRREYSLAELTQLCSEYFTIDDVIGIKAGRIVIPGEPYGTNTVLACRKDSGRSCPGTEQSGRWAHVMAEAASP